MGTISSSGDLDYFAVRLNSGQSISAVLDVPTGVDYDLYLLDNRGRTKVRSVNDGNGVQESLSYTNTNRRQKTFYLLIESYSGSSASNQWHLRF